MRNADIPTVQRAQRILRKSRIPRIRDYMLQNPDDYVFSSITASVASTITFEPVSEDMKDIGTISISNDASILINDGQHRAHAIKLAVAENPELGQDQISVVLFEDLDLEKSQQMFADLNKHAVKPTKSLGILYDHRNSFASFVVSMIKSINVFHNRIEMEKTSISNRSTKFFTLNGLELATKNLVGKDRNLKDDEKEIVIDFWNAVVKKHPGVDSSGCQESHACRTEKGFCSCQHQHAGVNRHCRQLFDKQIPKGMETKTCWTAEHRLEPYKPRVGRQDNNPWQDDKDQGGNEQCGQDSDKTLRGNLMKSVFKFRTLDDIYAEIQKIYLSNKRPWILGFSGGKDSTCMIQIVWSALERLPPSKLTKKIYIISSDTLVESPKIVETVTDSLERMESAAKRSLLPIETNLVRPVLSDTFWVCMIGKGYPAPSNTFPLVHGQAEDKERKQVHRG